MKSIVTLLLGIGSIFVIEAQSYLNITNSDLHVSPGAYLKVNGYVNNDGDVNNNGELSLTHDLSTTGSYVGNGLLHFNGTVDQNLSSPSTFSASNIQVNNGNHLQLNCDTEISSNLNLSNNGSVLLSTQNLTIQSGANISNYDLANYIITNLTGYLAQEVSANNTIFPIGLSSYNPAILNNSGTTDFFQIRVMDQVYDGGTSGNIVTSGIVDRTWMINEEIIGDSDLRIDLYWQGPQELTFNRTACGVSHYQTSQWDVPAAYAPATVDGSFFYQSRSNITSFSPFRVQDVDIDLPISLLDFSGKRTIADEVQLDWITESEQSNKGFQLQRQLASESTFENIEFIPGHGNSNQQRKYQFIDFNASKEVSYYRLKQVDDDGSFTYSSIIAVQGLKMRDFDISIRPNPVRDIISVIFADDIVRASIITAKITSVDGTVIKKWDMSSEDHTLSLPINDLPIGTYILQLNGRNGESFIKKFIKH